MAFTIRRIGGLKRFLLLIVGGVATLYLLQSLYINFTSRDRRSVADFQPTIEIDVQSRTIAGKCGVSPACLPDQMSFNISTSSGDAKPQACLNDLLLLSSDKVAKGLNVVVVDEKQKSVQDIKYFDLSNNDLDFIGFVSSLADNRIIIVLSWGGVASKISVEGKMILKKFGSVEIDSLKGDDSFLMIGQKGLKSGSSMEKIGAKLKAKSDGSVLMKGCLNVPMGELSPVTFVRTDSKQPPEIKVGRVVRSDFISFGPKYDNCGRSRSCPSHEVSVAVYTGKNKDDEPRICVNDRWIMRKNLNNAGRGLNIVVLNATSKEILRLGHFDTYDEDSSTLEIFLEDMVQGEMLIVVSFDEASQKLSSMSKQIFYELGSGMIQNLKFRASWFFIGQKGVNGFSPFEEMTYASGSDWAKPIEQFLCVPHTLDGQRVKPDPTVHARNEAKRHFCSKYDGYEEFCEESRLDDEMTPAPLYNRSLQNHPIFNVPILVVAGLSHNSLRICLETLIHQPGINVQNILVTYDENYAESLSLAKLFGVKVLPVPASSSYNVQMIKSVDMLWTQFPKAEFGIILEEELLLTSDFLFYMAQMLSVLEKDSTMTLSISAFNENGFTGASSMSDVAYRVEGFPGLAFLIRKSTYTTLMQGNMESCCANRSWEGWLKESQLGSQFMIVPDVSRVYRRHSEGLGMVEPHVEDLFHRSRAYNSLPDPWIHQADLLVAGRYDSHVKQLIAQSEPINVKVLLDGGCGEKTLAIPQNLTGKVFSVTFEQKVVDDYSQLSPLLECFGLFHSKGLAPRGLYKGVLRFSFQQNHFLLVGSKTELSGKNSPIPTVLATVDKILDATEKSTVSR